MTTVVTELSDSPVRGRVARFLERRPDVHWDAPSWLVVVSMLAAFGLHLWAARDVFSPEFYVDEIGYIADGLVIATGGDPGWTLGGMGYMPGLGVLIAPLWWFTSDAFEVYRIAIYLNIALAMAAIVPLGRIAQKAGATRRTGLLIGAIVSLAPARVAMSNYVLAEHLYLLAVAVSFLVVARFLKSPTWPMAVAAGVSVATVSLSHGRGAAFGVAFAVLGLVWVRRAPLKVISSVAIAGAGSIASFGLYLWVTDILYFNDGRVERLAAAVTWDAIPLVVLEMIGQAWYGVAAFLGIAALGVLWCVRSLRGDAFRQFVLIAMAATAALSSVSITRGILVEEFARVDFWFYGRYLDAFWVVLATVGIAVLIRVRWPAMTLVALGIVAAVNVAFVALVIPRMPEGGTWQAVHAAGVVYLIDTPFYIDDTTRPWALTGAIVVALTAVVLASAYIRVFGPAVVAAVLALSVIPGEIGIGQFAGSRPPDPTGIRNVPDDAAIAVNIAQTYRLNITVFSRHPLPVEVVERAPQTTDVYITGTFDIEAAEFGARLLDQGDYSKVRPSWIYPGDYFDMLDEAGRLLTVEESRGEASD